MKKQWGLILSLIFSLIIAIFSVINVNSVKVNYLFGTAHWPLILVILSSVLMGALLVGSFGMVRMYRLQRRITRLNKQIKKMEAEHEEVKNTSSESSNNSLSKTKVTTEQTTEQTKHDDKKTSEQ